MTPVRALDLVCQWVPVALAAVVVACSAAPSDRDIIPPADAAAWERLVAAEDGRVVTPEQRSVVLNALEAQDSRMRSLAVRALGRTERSEFADEITQALHDSSEDVAAAAAHALAYVSRDSTTADQARAALLDALPHVSGAAAGAIAESLGRLPSDDRAASAAARAITVLLDDDDTRTGAVRGLYFLARQRAGSSAVRTAADDALRAIALDATDASVRGLALATLAAAGAADASTLTAALRDPEPQVRREAVMSTRGLRGTDVEALLSSALMDPHYAVRHAALVSSSPHIDSRQDPACTAIAAAARDTSIHVARAALQLLAGPCADPRNTELLDSIAATAADGNGWHRAARATLALAAADVERAHTRVHALARHTSPFARAHAAHAARVTRDTALLRQLAADPNVNVRTAAVSGLGATVGHGADSTFIAQLDTTESELLMVAAEALRGSTHPRAPAALLDAFDRVSALRRETSRDARLGLLNTIAELGGRQHAARLEPYLRDYDTQVVMRVVEIMNAWTGTRPQGMPQPLSSLAPPTYDEALRLARSTFVLEMQNGEEIRIRLLPFDAPTNAARFARLARAGYYDGLTIHRVEPNFVVQGGSPGANEYSGDGPYTRDEVGVSNLRGTVGLSTRGRDTGDAQFYVNLIDNVRLDHQYTVFGRVVGGMDVVDALLEGAVIRRVREDSR